MNTSQRLSALLLAITSASTSSWAGSTAGQDLNLSVDPVGLIAIGKASSGLAPSINFNAPTVAGESFTDVSPNPVVSDGTFPIAITSNLTNAKLKANAKVGTQGLSSYKLVLTLQPSGSAFGSSNPITLPDTGSDIQISSVNKVATGTLASGNTSGHQLTLYANADANTGMLPYGSYTVTITYTLTGTGI